jgi:hypothetical protein
MNKKFFVAAMAILAFASINALNATAQSCPISESFGVRSYVAADKGLQSKIEVTYFSTDDPNVFISEKSGFNHSASYVSLNTKQFVAQVEKLEREGLASVKKRESSTSYLGEVAEINLERNSLSANHAILKAKSARAGDVSGLERRTEVSVYQGRASDGDSYRLSLLSWMVDGKAKGAQNVDYDAIVLVKPGQTALFKVKGNGAEGGRSYIAVTVRSVGTAAQAAR